MCRPADFCRCRARAQLGRPCSPPRARSYDPEAIRAGCSRPAVRGGWAWCVLNPWTGTLHLLAVGLLGAWHGRPPRRTAHLRLVHRVLVTQLAMTTGRLSPPRTAAPCVGQFLCPHPGWYSVPRAARRRFDLAWTYPGHHRVEAAWRRHGGGAVARRSGGGGA